MDKWLIRAKDFLLLFGAIAAVVIFAGKFYGLPEAVASSKADIVAHDKRIIKLEEGQTNIVNRLERMDNKLDRLLERRTS